MGFEEFVQFSLLLFRVAGLCHLFHRWQERGLAHLAEKGLHFACGLIHIDDFSGSSVCAAPHMSNIAWQENRFTGTGTESLFADLELELPLNDVDPFILFVM